MIAIPKAVEYALMAIREMAGAEPGRVFAVRGLCEQHGVPFDVMSRALQRLQRVGVVRAVRGVLGGYQLSRAPGSVTLLEVCEAVSGPLKPVRCLAKAGDCPRATRCTLVGSMRSLDERMRAFYADIPVGDLLNENGRRAPRRRRVAAATGGSR